MTRSQATPISSQMLMMEKMIMGRDDEITRLTAERDRALDRIAAMAAELEYLHQQADKYSDGIDWIQRAMQAEAKLDAAEICRDEAKLNFALVLSERDALRVELDALKNREPVVTKRKNGIVLHTGWDPLPVGAKLYAAPTPPSVPDFADAYQGAMEEVAIWKKRALEAEALNRKFMAEINGPTHMGEPVATPPSVPDGWVESINDTHRS